VSVPLVGFTTLRLLRGSAHARIYEAERDEDHHRVLAKVFEIDDAAAEARVLHEFGLLRELDIEGVVRPIAVERSGREMVLLLDYVPGRNLAQVAGGQPLSVARFLPWALRMAEILAAIHAQRIVHRDVKPSNILVEAGSERIVFADFGISVLLEGERRRLHDPDVLHGTLPYISPEQTGRTRREVDFRSDLYGLGVTFYELLTGQRPFEALNPLELVHAHLTRTPKPPIERAPELPEQLSKIVMRLLEKAPEHRYQSALGLGADLRRVAEALDRGERPRFVLGRDDRPQTLQLPHQLYGRELELDILDEEFGRSIEQSSRRLVLIGGGLGLGKSALLTTLEPQLSRYGGYLGLGQFDGARDTPYAGIIQGVRSLIGQILTESEAQLERWSARLRTKLGAIGGVVNQLVPELELIIGEVEAPPELGHAERKNRLHLGLSRLLAGICEVAPVILALDDLHFADHPTLELLAALTREGAGPLLVIASFRSDLGEASAEIEGLLAGLDAQDRPCRAIELAPLDDAALSQLLADTLGAQAEQLDALARYVARKTGRRPLYVRQLLVYLAEQGLIRAVPGRWAWDMAALAEAPVPDDLLTLLAAKLDRLDPIHRQVLELAACVGERLDPAELPLAETLELSPLELFTAIHALELEGLIDTIGTELRFAHAQLRELVHERMLPSWRRRAHTALGRRMLDGAGGVDALARAAGARLFEVVEHLDEGIDPEHALADEVRAELVSLNLHAGDRALDETAWPSARRYYSFASGLLGEGSLRDEERFRVHFGLAQTLYLAGEFTRADALFEALLAAEPSLPDLTAVTARRIDILTHLRRTRRATELGVEALRRCGLEIPERFALADLTRRVPELVREFTLERLLALPPMTDERVLAMMRILGPFHSISFTVDRELYIYLLTTHLELVLDHGFHISVTSALSTIGFALLGMRDFSEARRVSELSIEIAEQRAESNYELQFADRGWLIFVGPCFHRFANFTAKIEAAHDLAVERGERTDAAFKAAIGLVLQYEAGRHLDEVGAMILGFHSSHEDWANTDISAIAGGAIWFHAELSGTALEPPAGVAALPEPAAWDAEHIAGLIRYGAVATRVWAATLLGDYARAWTLVETIAADYEEVLFGNWVVPRHAMLDAVATVEHALAAGEDGERSREEVRARLVARRESAAQWAERGPDNFAAHVEIIAGEIAAFDGDVPEAVRCYERACAHGAKQRRAWVEALACLRLAALGERVGWPTVAEGALGRALRAFERWGAWAAVTQIHRRLGQVPAGGGDGDEITASHTGTSSYLLGPHSLSERRSSSVAMPSLDLSAVLDTVRSIGEDLRLEEVIRRVLASATESAGADRGLLLLDREGELMLVAESKLGETNTDFDEALAFAEAREQLPSSAIYYVVRTGVALVVDDVRGDVRFSGDPYVKAEGIRSLLCMPIIKQGVRMGALVLESRQHTGVFTDARLETSRLLLAQAASAIDNARLYAELARSEAQWRSLVDGAPDMITLLDEQGQVEFINHVERPDLDPEALLGRPADELFDAESAERWRAAFVSVLSDGEPRELELCMAPADGIPRWFVTRLAAIRVGGRLRRVLAIARDVTERKRFEAQQRQQQRLESLGTLAAGVAHEINNPVQGIINYAELIADCPEDVETVIDFAAEITSEAERVGTIVRQLLLFARRERDQQGEDRELVDVRSLIESTLTLIRSVMRQDQVQLDIEIADQLPPLPCQPQQIRQVLMNLVTNARDALNEHYPEYDENKWLCIGAEAFGLSGRPWLRIWVADSAGGIPEDVLSHIFDPFFTTKARDQGTGLGLAVSHGIAQDHGGDLRVEVDAGVGSRFLLELPAAEV